jgi:hypothetical protein
VKSLCPDHFISRSLMDLECNCLVLCNTQNLSDLSNNLSNDLWPRFGNRKREAKTFVIGRPAELDDLSIADNFKLPS